MSIVDSVVNDFVAGYTTQEVKEAENPQVSEQNQEPETQVTEEVSQETPKDDKNLDIRLKKEQGKRKDLEYQFKILQDQHTETLKLLNTLKPNQPSKEQVEEEELIESMSPVEKRLYEENKQMKQMLEKLTNNNEEKNPVQVFLIEEEKKFFENHPDITEYELKHMFRTFFKDNLEFAAAFQAGKLPFEDVYAMVNRKNSSKSNQDSTKVFGNVEKQTVTPTSAKQVDDRWGKIQTELKTGDRKQAVSDAISEIAGSIMSRPR